MEVQKIGGAIRGLRKCVGLLLGSRDFVINGEYWMKSCLIARMECQEMPLMVPAMGREEDQRHERNGLSWISHTILNAREQEKKSLEDKTLDCYYVTAILSQSLVNFTQNFKTKNC